jgi:uncharacterized membrane protein
MSADTDIRIYGVSTRQVVSAVLVLHVLFPLTVWGARYSSLPLGAPRVVLATLLVAFVPGLLLCLLFGLDSVRTLSLLLYSVGLSLVTAILLGVGASLLLPLVSVPRPFGLLPLLGLFYALNVGLSVPLWVRDRPVELPLSETLRPVSLAFLPAPFVLVVATVLLNRTGAPEPLLVSLVVFAVAFPVLAVVAREDGPTALALWLLSVALLYHTTLWQGTTVTEVWMPVVSLELGRWYPVIGAGIGHEGLLPHGVLYPVLSVLTGLSPESQLKLVNPLFVSLLPLLVYQVARRYLTRRESFLATLVLVFSHQFFASGWPMASRDAMATLFLAFLLLTVFNERLTPASRSVLTVAFLVGVTVSHYGVAFLTFGVLMMAVTIKIVSRDWVSIPDERVTVTAVLLMFVLVHGWYLVVSSGETATLLFARVVATIADPGASGPSARAIQAASPLSTLASKALYVFLSGLMGVGIVSRVVDVGTDYEIRVETEFLLLGVGFLSALIATFLPLGGAFGTGRVIGVTYTVIGLFAVVGVVTLARVFGNARTVVQMYGSTDWPADLDLRRPAQILFVLLLVTFFAVNAGLVAFFIEGDDAQSQILYDQRLRTSDDEVDQWRASGCFECDADSLGYLAEHRVEGRPVYSDARASALQWYAFAMLSGSDVPIESAFALNSTLRRENQPNLWLSRDSLEPDSYVWLHHNNLRTGMLQETRWGGELVSMEPLEPRLDNSSRVYTSGKSEVYLTGE